MTDYKNYTKDQWREKLTTDQYRVAREHGTEPLLAAFTMTANNKAFIVVFVAMPTCFVQMINSIRAPAGLVTFVLFRLKL